MKANDINFLPDSYRYRVRRSRNRVRILVGAVLLTGCLIAWSFSQRSDIRESREYANTVEQQVLAAQQQASEIGRLRARYISLTRQAGVRTELAQPVRHTQVLAVIAQLLPPSVGLVEVEIKAERPEPQKADEKASSKNKKDEKPPQEFLEVDLRGMAASDEDVNDTLGRLSDHRLFEHVTLSYSRDETRNGLVGREFAISMEIDLKRRYVPKRTEEVADAQ
jgi:Tfp pilus assembly protein PilN